MEHEEPLVADGEHVGVEGARVDPVGVLLREEAARRVEAVQAREGLARLERLARGVAARPGERRPRRDGPTRRGAPRPRRRDEARVVGGPFVGELPAAGEGVVHDEARRVGEDGAEDARRRRRLDRAVEHLLEVRGREVHAPVGARRTKARRWRRWRSTSATRSSRARSKCPSPDGRAQR